VRTRPHSISTLVSRCRVVNRETLPVVRCSYIALSDFLRSRHASAAGCVKAATTISNNATTMSAALPSRTISLKRSGSLDLPGAYQPSRSAWVKPASGEHVARLV
jgi:hypothetical protein